jgi:hypothetical protein
MQPATPDTSAASVQVAAAAQAQAQAARDLIAVSSPAPATGVRPEIEQSLDRAEDIFKREDATAAMQMVLAVEAVPDLNRDEKHQVAIVRSFITPYSTFSRSGAGDNPFFHALPMQGPTGLGVGSFLPPGDVGPNDPSR